MNDFSKDAVEFSLTFEKQIKKFRHYRTKNSSTARIHLGTSLLQFVLGNGSTVATFGAKMKKIATKNNFDYPITNNTNSRKQTRPTGQTFSVEAFTVVLDTLYSKQGYERIDF